MHANNGDRKTEVYEINGGNLHEFFYEGLKGRERKKVNDLENYKF